MSIFSTFLQGNTSFLPPHQSHAPVDAHSLSGYICTSASLVISHTFFNCITPRRTCLYVQRQHAFTYTVRNSLYLHIRKIYRRKSWICIGNWKLGTIFIVDLFFTPTTCWIVSFSCISLLSACLITFGRWWLEITGVDLSSSFRALMHSLRSV